MESNNENVENNALSRRQRGRDQIDQQILANEAKLDIERELEAAEVAKVHAAYQAGTIDPVVLPWKTLDAVFIREKERTALETTRRSLQSLKDVDEPLLVKLAENGP